MMKNNLLKILVTLGLVVGVSACQKKKDGPSDGDESKESESLSESGSTEEEPQGPIALPNLASALEVDYDQMDEETGEVPFVYEGQLISIPNLGVCGHYGNTYIVNQNWQQPSVYGDFSGITVELGANETSNAYVYDVVNVQGVLTTVRGHAELKDGKITEIVRPAWEIKEDGTRGARLQDADGKNIGSCYYIKADTRSTFGKVAAPNNSGALADLYVQFASLPEEKITATNEQSFYVVYAGENMDLEDEENNSPIEVRIPAGLAERTVNRLNAYLFPEEEGAVAPAVGDFSIITGCLEFHDWGQGLVIEDYFSGFEEMNPADIPEVFSTFAELYEDYGAPGILFGEGMFNFEDKLDNATAFSYVPGDYGRFMELFGDIIEQYPETVDPASESREFFLDDLNNAVYISYTVNSKDQDALVDAANAALVAGGLKAITGFKLDNNGSVMYIYTLTEGEGEEAKVTRQVNLNVYVDGTLVIEDMAKRVIYEGSVSTVLTTMNQTNNATYVDNSSSGLYITYWDGAIMESYAKTSKGESDTYYTVINGKYAQNGLWSFSLNESDEIVPGDYYGNYNVNAFGGSPKQVATILSVLGQTNEDDDQAVVTIEDFAKACYASAEEYAEDKGVTIEEAQEKWEADNADTLNSLAREFANAVGYGTTYINGTTFVKATLTLVADNTYELKVYFTYSEQTVAVAVQVANIGTTDLSDIADKVAALPDYVAPEGGEGGEGGNN